MRQNVLVLLFLFVDLLLLFDVGVVLHPCLVAMFLGSFLFSLIFLCCGCMCSVSFPCSAVGSSVVCDGCISWSYTLSLVFWKIDSMKHHLLLQKYFKLQ